MKDRSTESDAATALERALLDAARSDSIPAELKARMAAGLVTPPPLTAASAVQPKASLRVGELLFSKTSLWGSLTLALIALGGAGLYRHARDRAVASADPTVPQAAASRPAAGADEPSGTHPERAEATPAVTSPGPVEAPSLSGATDGAPALTAAGTRTLSASQPLAARADRPRPRREAKQTPAESDLGTSTGGAREAEETSADATELHEREGAGPAAAAATQDPGPSALREELVLLDRARDALRSGSHAQALSLLDQHAARFARGALAPEADALAIETLLRSGARERAAQRAERFLQRHAGHPLAAQIERWRDAALR